jgi:4-amino-4-deoxy-L-arabinose transferase-like glycosyltransferase
MNQSEMQASGSVNRPLAWKRVGWAPFVVLLLSAGTLLLGLGWPQLWDRDEPRNAGCTAEMLARADWVVPMFNAELRTHKPILLYWLQMVTYQVAGANEWGARLPSALLMIGTIFCSMFLSSRLLTHRFGLGRSSEAGQSSDQPVAWYQWNSPAMWSGIVLATSLMVVVAGRAATPDSPLIFCSTLTVTAFLFAFTCSTRERRREVYFLLAYTAMGLGILAKGPVGFVLPFTVISAWFQWERILEDKRWSQFSAAVNFRERSILMAKILVARLAPREIWNYVSQTRLLLGLLVVLAVALPWYILVGLRTEGRWLREFLWEHNVQRAVQSMEGHRGSLLYYPGAILVGLFPWSLWLAPFLLWLWRTAPWGQTALRAQPTAASSNNQNPLGHRAAGDSTSSASLTRLALLWVAVYIGAFSCASTKLPSYITPCYPGAALLIGLFLASLANGTRSAVTLGSEYWTTWRGLRWATLATIITTSVAGLVATGVLAFAANQEQMPWVVVNSFWSLSLTLGAAGGAWSFYQHRLERIPVWFAAGALICLSGWMAGGASCASGYRQDLSALQAQQLSNPNQRWLAVGVLEPSWVFYTGKPITEIQVMAPSADGMNWQEKVQQRWQVDPTLGVITLEPWGNELVQHWRLKSDTLQQRYRLVKREYPYFLRHQPLVLITLEPHESNRSEFADQTDSKSLDFRR